MNPHALSHLFHEELYRFTPPLVVVLRREWAAYSPDDQALLKKILTSVKLDIHAVMIMARPSLQLEDVQAYAPARVLVFGSELPAGISLYQQTAAQGLTLIGADDLTALDEAKKKNLWMALKQMFAV